VCTFARDEPTVAVIEAAALVADMEIDITGDPARAPEVELPPNARLVGFMPPDEYAAALADADVVMSLTTEPTSAMRAGFEAVWAEKVLVVSDWPLLEELFPEAVHVANTPESIAEGLRRAVAEHRELYDGSRRMSKLQEERWAAPAAALRSATGRGPL
jgi:hypothetical protein